MSDMTDKLAKLLNQAENAATPEEADAFLKAAQMLSTKHSISLAVARAHIAKSQKREEPEERTISVVDFGKNGRKPAIELYSAIAFNNDIKCDISHNSNYIYPFGFPSDLDVVEAMFASLATQMVNDANEYIKAGDYKTETQMKLDRKTYTWVEKPIDGRTARSNFYSGFIRRVNRRLATARMEATDEALEEAESSTGTELVLADKKREVEDFYKKNSEARGSWKGSSRGGYSASATSAGDLAGSRASLTEQSTLGGPRKGITA